MLLGPAWSSAPPTRNAQFLCSGMITLRIARGIQYVPPNTNNNIQMVSTLNGRWPETGADVVVKIDRSSSFGV
jgi:hypothetical protein